MPISVFVCTSQEGAFTLDDSWVRQKIGIKWLSMRQNQGQVVWLVVSTHPTNESDPGTEIIWGKDAKKTKYKAPWSRLFIVNPLSMIRAWLNFPSFVNCNQTSASSVVQDWFKHPLSAVFIPHFSWIYFIVCCFVSCILYVSCMFDCLDA